MHLLDCVLEDLAVEEEGVSAGELGPVNHSSLPAMAPRKSVAGHGTRRVILWVILARRRGGSTENAKLEARQASGAWETHVTSAPRLMMHTQPRIPAKRTRGVWLSGSASDSNYARTQVERGWRALKRCACTYQDRGPGASPRRLMGYTAAPTRFQT